MSDLYLATPDVEKGSPSGCDSLIDIYHLRSFANSMARQDPHTGAKRKLRKSYKNHIADLPGRQSVPGVNETKWKLLHTALESQNSQNTALSALDIPDSMLFGLSIIPGPLQNYDTSLLALPLNQPDDTTINNPMNAEERRDKRKRREGSVQIDKRRKL